MTKVMNKRRGVGSLLDTIEGHCSWILRNADGSIAEQGEGKNLFTRVGRRVMGYSRFLPGIVAIMDDAHPAGVREGLRVLKADTLTPTPYQTISPSVGGYTRTFTGSFSAPSATRTIRKIGLLETDGSSLEGGMLGVSAYLHLTTPVVQTTLQTFEFVYRMTLVPTLVKSLSRYNPWTPITEAAIASIFVNNTSFTGYERTCHMRSTQGSGFFVDGGLIYRAAPMVAIAGNEWASSSITFRDATLQRMGADLTFLITNGYNNYRQGPVGTFATNYASSALNQYAFQSLKNTTLNRAQSFSPIAAYEGTLTNVFKHVAGETYAWNVVGSVALSQGNVEIRGPFIPDEHKAPWHWLHWVKMITGGDTDPGTEGTYTIQRMPWFGYPYPNFISEDNTTWDLCEPIGSFVSSWDAVWAYKKHQTAFDGEYYWSANYVAGTNVRLMRWRAGSNEQLVMDTVGDTTRFQPFTAPDATSYVYGVASDGAGTVWLSASNSTLASQKFYKIDNTKPGRQYQRPSGAVLTANPQTFTVDAADEIHAMHPFAVGDVGRKIRIVNTVSNGADTTRTITAYNSPTSVDVDGAAFVTETGMTWHWETVTTMATNPWPAKLQGWLGYDAANARLWAMSANGLHYSTDGGATWGTIDELNGLSTTLAKSLKEPGSGDSSETIVVGNGGKLYWIDTNNAINKYVPGGSIFGGTHTRVDIASLPAAPSGYTKGTLTSLIYDANAPDISADSDGALWLGQDNTYLRCFFRIPCGTFSGGTATAYSETSIGGAPGSYLDYSFQMGFARPDGSVYFWNNTRQTQIKRCYFHETTGTLTWVNEGAVVGTPNAAGSPWGHIHVRPNGLIYMLSTANDSGSFSGAMAGAPITYRYNDLTDTWIPFLGSAAQFNAKTGSTLGGARKCHAAWQKALKGAQSNNIELRFVQNGAAAPADEFVVNESFAYGAAFGLSRTNVQDVTWRGDTGTAETEVLVESEAIKTVAAPAALKCHYWRVATSAGETAKPLGVAAYPTSIPEFNASGVNYGWMPSRASYYAGGGSLPDAGSATYGATSHSQQLIGLDLGAGPPAISRLHTFVGASTFYYYLQRYHRTSDRGRMRVYYSDDNAVWTEASSVRFQLNGASAPDPGYEFVYVEHYPYGGLSPNSTDPRFHIVFDLEASGMSVGDRTHRYWQIHIGSNDTSNVTSPYFGGVYATDSADIPFGLTSAFRTDEAHDTDHGASRIFAVDFIQTRTGLSGQGTISTVDDGDADGRTNTVAIDSGSFDTGVISTVTDYLAWRETPSMGNGYIRTPRGVAGRAMPWALGYQARSRIISASASTIVVADDIIPDSLSGVNFEIRRPATGTVLSAGSMPHHDYQTGYLQFHSSDVGREFRITRKSIVRLP
jgi:hypothetical protein